MYEIALETINSDLDNKRSFIQIRQSLYKNKQTDIFDDVSNGLKNTHNNNSEKIYLKRENLHHILKEPNINDFMFKIETEPKISNLYEDILSANSENLKLDNFLRTEWKNSALNKNALNFLIFMQPTFTFNSQVTQSNKEFAKNYNTKKNQPLTDAEIIYDKIPIVESIYPRWTNSNSQWLADLEANCLKISIKENTASNEDICCFPFSMSFLFFNKSQ